MAELQYPVAGAVITQRFGENPASYAAFGLAGHNGVDFGVLEGTPVRAAAAGRVERANHDPSGYGLHIRIAHPVIAVTLTLYGHLSRLAVQAGQAVQAGEVIGWSGNTGNSTGPHLHFEARGPGAAAGFGGALDPLPLLGELGREAGRLYQVRVMARLGVNLRAGPAKSAAIVGAAAHGDLLDVFGECPGWVRVGFGSWACTMDGSHLLLMRADLEGGLECWQQAIDAWARARGFDGPPPA